MTRTGRMRFADLSGDPPFVRFSFSYFVSRCASLRTNSFVYFAFFLFYFPLELAIIGERARAYTYFEGEVIGSDAKETIEIGRGDAATGSVAVEESVEPQLDDLVVFTLEAVHAAAKSVPGCTFSDLIEFTCFVGYPKERTLDR